MGAQTLRRLWRILLYIGVTLPAMLVQALLLATGWRRPATRFPRAYHALCCRALGIGIEVHGAPSRRRPTLFVANHTSYLDISIIGAVVEGSFVAKAEVARWPLFGWLAKLQRSVFVDRRVRSTHVQRDQLRERLDAGDSLILFPEGTSDDGMRVLPFKSALLSVADYRHDGVPLAVQPVTVAYLRLDGIPLGRFLRPFFAWYGDMELAPHLWSMLGLGVLSVSVQFHPVVTLAEFGSRKALAEHCHRVVSAGLSLALAGRLRPAADAPARVPAGEPAAAAADAAGTS